MNWTKQLPTEPGGYWVYGRLTVGWADVYIGEGEVKLYADMAWDHDWGDDLQEFVERHAITHWIGPIATPAGPID